MATRDEKESEEATLKSKYNRKTGLSHCQGFTKPNVLTVLEYEFAGKIISVVPDKEKRRFVVLLKSTVNDKAFTRFKAYWDDSKKIVEIHKSAG